MSEFGLQQALVRVLTDAKLTQAAIRGDLQSLTESGVTAEDATQLLKIDHDRFQKFAELIAAQRLDDLENMLPLTTQVLASRVREFDTVFREHTVAQFSKRREYALSFADFLREEFRRQEPEPPFLLDVLNYEMTCLALFEQRYYVPSHSNPVPASTLDDKAARSRIKVFRSPTNCTLRLSYDVLKAINHMRETSSFVPPETRSMILLLRGNRSGSIEHDQINEATSRFLELCNDDGIFLGKIISRLAADYRLNQQSIILDFEEKCVDLCKSLTTRSIIELAVD
jgi:hypothetical protein